jgi:Zinc finger C-x8-C-x5-C-x3-H type (and similar)/Zinc finger, C3HC4 type (RING finger)/RNA-binding, Nab2-type zinc finger
MSISSRDAAGEKMSRQDDYIGDSPSEARSRHLLDPALCRHFALRGTCRFQDDCHYSHVLPDDCADWNEACQRIPCPHYGRGICRYGSMCRLAHSQLSTGDFLLSSQESQHQIRPYQEQSSTPDDFDDRKMPAVSSDNPNPDSQDLPEIASSENTCGICLEPLGQTRNNKGEIKHNRKKFGLLSACDHIFCIQCLRTWRFQQKKETSNEGRNNPTAEDATGSDRVRACPLCRQPSDFIVPSDRFCVGQEKEQVVAAYKARLSCTPCKRFTGKLGSCPFGADCFYAHWDSHTGEDMKILDKTKQELWREKAEKQRLKAQRRRLQYRRRFFPNISPEEMDAMEDLIYLSSMEMILNPLNRAIGNESATDAEQVGQGFTGLLADRLMYVDNNGNTTFGSEGITLDPRYLEVILDPERLRSLGILERVYNEHFGERDS